MIILLILLVIVSPALGQHTTIVENRSVEYTVLDSVLSGAGETVMTPYTGHSGWFRVDPYKYFASYFEFDTTGTTGIGAGDTVEVSMEHRPNTLISGGFLKLSTLRREVIATFDSVTILNYPRTFVSYHDGSGPEISLAGWVRFYVRVVGGFTGAGLRMRKVFKVQP